MTILVAVKLGVAVFAVAAIAATVEPGGLATPAAVVHVSLFVVGLGAFAWAYLTAISRSRKEVLSVAGIWFLAGGSAPPQIRRTFMLALGIEVVGSLAAASIRPFTAVAFAILAPMHALGLMGLWGARHGTFERRRPGSA